MIVCSSRQTFPRLWKSCSKRRVSSLFRPADPSFDEPGAGLDVVETDDTREETNAEVGVAEPAASRGDEQGGVRIWELRLADV